MRPTRFLIPGLLAVLPIVPVNAKILGRWTFDSGESSADLLASSDVAKGAIISGLSFNDSFTNFGPEAVPKDLHDGFSVGM